MATVYSTDPEGARKRISKLAKQRSPLIRQLNALRNISKHEMVLHICALERRVSALEADHKALEEFRQWRHSVTSFD